VPGVGKEVEVATLEQVHADEMFGPARPGGQVPKTIAFCTAAVLGAALVMNLPDIRRYLRMSRM
ncbi:hypothetical protein, partial [Streptomyces sp. NPDC031705]|uniref:DUF6893 family small protein n=1 Tax=Streptomyces sp. NPDC031705 TaxID=3155729 RepID=UPI0033E57B33